MSHFRPMLGPPAGLRDIRGRPPGFVGGLQQRREECRALRGLPRDRGLRKLSEDWAAAQPTPVPSVCGFTVFNRTVTPGRDPAPLAATPVENFELRHRIWLEDVLTAMGFPTGSITDRVEQVRRGLLALTFLGLRVADAFPLLVTKYPCHRPAHAACQSVVLSWPEVVAGYPTNVDAGFAHEIGHFSRRARRVRSLLDHGQRRILRNRNTNCALASQTPPLANPALPECVASWITTTTRPPPGFR